MAPGIVARFPCAQALVEISTSGANPSAAATTGLIPTRGPRRAAVVACSSGLVRDLISACVSLRAENAALTARLSKALAGHATTVTNQQARPNPGAIPGMNAPALSGDSSSGPDATKVRNGPEIAGAAAPVAVAAGDEFSSTRGAGAAKVFGQLLALTVFNFLGPRSLEEGRRVCRSWRDKCTWDCW